MFSKVAPLSAGFMLTSILGAMISAVYIFPKSPSFGFTFFLVFAVMFIAALVSMTLAPVESEFDTKREKNRKVKR